MTSTHNRDRNVTLPCLKLHADPLESSAAQALPSRILLGQTDKHASDMEEVRRIRHAMTLRTATERRQFLGWYA